MYILSDRKTYPEKFEKGLPDDRTDDGVNLVLIEGVHTFHITATLVYLTSQLQPMNTVTFSTVDL